MSLVPTASLVLGQVVRELAPREIAISSYGIREGLLYDRMPDMLRGRDPLIEACLVAEQKDARLPGFGRALYDFVKPLFEGVSPSRRRLIKAACLLHDVSWRAHPDYRHEVCFDYATRANLGGMTHGERVFLGLALLHRYKNNRAGTVMESLLALLDPAEIREAEVLGKAMRFGAMFSTDRPADMAKMTWSPETRQLELHLTTPADDLFGEVAEAGSGPCPTR